MKLWIAVWLKSVSVSSRCQATTAIFLSIRLYGASATGFFCSLALVTIGVSWPTRSSHFDGQLYRIQTPPCSRKFGTSSAVSGLSEMPGWGRSATCQPEVGGLE